MKDFWKEPKTVRNSIQRKTKQLLTSINDRKQRIAELERWLNGVKASLIEDEKELAQIRKDYEN